MDKPSDRRALIERFAAFIIANNFTNPFGGEVYEGGNRRFYAVDLSIPRLLDGTVRVYGAKFILVLMRGPLALGGGERVYATEENAMNFLRLLLVEHKTDEALNIPIKAQK